MVDNRKKVQTPLRRTVSRTSAPRFMPVPPVQAKRSPQSSPVPEVDLDPQNYQIDLANPLASMYGHGTTTPNPIQAKLAVGIVGTRSDQEAEPVAAQAVDTINAPLEGTQPVSSIQRNPEKNEKYNFDELFSWVKDMVNNPEEEVGNLGEQKDDKTPGQDKEVLLKVLENATKRQEEECDCEEYEDDEEEEEEQVEGLYNLGGRNRSNAKVSGGQTTKGYGVSV